MVLYITIFQTVDELLFEKSYAKKFLVGPIITQLNSLDRDNYPKETQKVQKYIQHKSAQISQGSSKFNTAAS